MKTLMAVVGVCVAFVLAVAVQPAQAGVQTREGSSASKAKTVMLAEDAVEVSGSGSGEGTQNKDNDKPKKSKKNDPKDDDHDDGDAGEGDDDKKKKNDGPDND